MIPLESFDERDTSCFRVIEVGQPYEPGCHQWPEGYHFNYWQGQAEFLISIKSPKPREAEALRRAPVVMGLAVVDEILFFVYGIKGFLYGEAPYTWHRLPEAVRVRPDPLIGTQRIPVTVILIDAATGIVKGWRLITMRPRVSRAFVRAVLDQAARPFDDATYRQALSRVYARYTCPEILQGAALDQAGLDEP